MPKDNMPTSTASYSPAEERLNIITHGLGFVLSIIATIFMLQLALEGNKPNTHWIGALAFGGSLSILYLASTLYHSAPEGSAKRFKLKTFDHVAIFFLIGGTYTPFTLITLKGEIGTTVLIVVWSLALIGGILKIFFVGRFKILSTIIYVAMGWIIVFAAKPMYENLAPAGLKWLVTGGVIYTTGAVLYSIKKIPFNHAIFHVFVLLGSFCHVISAYYYVL